MRDIHLYRHRHKPTTHSLSPGHGPPEPHAPHAAAAHDGMPRHGSSCCSSLAQPPSPKAPPGAIDGRIEGAFGFANTNTALSFS